MANATTTPVNLVARCPPFLPADGEQITTAKQTQNPQPRYNRLFSVRRPTSVGRHFRRLLLVLGPMRDQLVHDRTADAIS